MIFQINTDAPGNLTKVFQCEIFPVSCLICMRVCVSEVDTLMFVLSYSPVNTIVEYSLFIPSVQIQMWDRKLSLREQSSCFDKH